MTIDRAADSAAAERMRRAAIEAVRGGRIRRQLDAADRQTAQHERDGPCTRTTAPKRSCCTPSPWKAIAACWPRWTRRRPRRELRRTATRGGGGIATWHAENHEQARVVQYELHGLTQAHYRTIAPLRHQATDVITRDRRGRGERRRVPRRQRRRGGDGHLVVVCRRMPVVPVAKAPRRAQAR